MSENNQAVQNYFKLKGFWILPAIKSGVLLDPSRGKPLLTIRSYPENWFVVLNSRFHHCCRCRTWQGKAQSQDTLHPYSRRIIAQRTQELFGFDQLTTIQPKDKLTLEADDHRMTTRVLDLFCPIGRGSEPGVAPPRAGKTTILHDVAKGVEQNHPECHLMVLLIDERPEEVADF